MTPLQHWLVGLKHLSRPKLMCVCNAAWFFNTVVSSLTDADRSDGILPTVLVSRKSEVQQGNARQIALLPGESVGCRLCISDATSLHSGY